MKVGISLMSAHPVEDPRAGARFMVERARAAASAGLDSLFVGDHHAVPIPYYQNTPILARCLAEWDERPAGALYLLPLWHPVLLAEQIGTLAAIAPGRFILQCALGAKDAQPAAMGVDPRHRPSRFEESLEIMRALFRGETVSHRGRFVIEGARIAPRPAEQVEVWIGASAPAAIERAARLGDGWIASPALTPDQASLQLAAYHEACEGQGRAAGATPIRRDVYVGADAAEAERLAGPLVARGHRGFPPEAPIVGGVAQVAEAFADLASRGFSDVIVRNMVSDQAHALACIDRLAEVRSAVAGA